MLAVLATRCSLLPNFVIRRYIRLASFRTLIIALVHTSPVVSNLYSMPHNALMFGVVQGKNARLST